MEKKVVNNSEGGKGGKALNIVLKIATFISKVILGISIVSFISFIAICFYSALKEKNTNNYDLTSDSYMKVREAYNRLTELDDTYIIANTLESIGTLCYLEVVSENGDCYTEYPLSEDGMYGQISTSDSSDTVYILYDWMDKDGNLYTLNSDYSGAEEETNYLWSQMPKRYSELVKSRELMFTDRMLYCMTDVSYIGEDTSIDEGKSFSIYEAKIPSSVVRDICGLETLGLYSSIREDNVENKSITDLMDYFIEDLEMSLTFSDGKVRLGVNTETGILSYVQIESGGLGSRMYYTKYLTQDSSIEVRETPDFSNSVNFIDDIVSLANYVSSYSSYDEAMSQLYSEQYSLSDEVPTLVEEESTSLIIEEETSNEETSLEIDTTVEETEETTEVSTEELTIEAET